MSEEVKMYSRRPFVSHAGPDENGYRQEVLVIKGIGNVVNIDDKGKTAQVEFAVPGRKYTSKGWINTDTKAFELAKEAFENGHAPLEFRIEQQRKAKDDTGKPIPAETPIYELMGADKDGNHKSMEETSKNTRRLLVGVASLNGEMEFSQDLTDPDEDPKYGTDSPTSARTNKSPVTMVSAPVTGNTPAGPSNAVESSPFTAINPDGTVNPGSYGAYAPIDMYLWIAHIENKSDEKGIELNLNDKRRKMLAHALLIYAGRIQMSLYSDGFNEPDREVGSYRNIINTMKGVIKEIHPLTPESISSKQAVDEWVKSVASETEQLMQWSLDNDSKELGLEDQNQ